MRTIIFLGLILGTWACSITKTTAPEPATKTTTIVLVRHAEKEAGRTPNLTTQGQERAERLATMLSNMNISTVYTTDFARTRQTAAPTAKEAGVDIQIYDHNNLETFANSLQTKHEGETILVVGHSNTTPAMASFLDPNNDYKDFPETNYTNLFIVTKTTSGATKVLKLVF